MAPAHHANSSPPNAGNMHLFHTKGLADLLGPYLLLFALSSPPPPAQECGEIRGRVQQVVQDMDLDEARTIFSTE